MPVPKSATKPSVSNASFPCEVNTLPRIDAPANTKIPTVTNTTMARPHIFCSACPRPGTAQPAIPMAVARFSADISGKGTSGGSATIGSSTTSGKFKFGSASSAMFFFLNRSYTHLRQQRQNFRLHRACHPGFLLINKHIHFTAQSKLRQINSRLHGIAGLRNQMPFVLSLQSIHIDAVSVHRVFSDTVSGAMNKILPVSRLFDYAARRFIHLPSLQRLPRLHAATNQLHRFVARLTHHIKYLYILVRHLRAQKARPRHIVVHTSRRLLLAPNVQQQKITFANRRRFFLRWRIMWIAGVRVHRNVRSFIRRNPRLCKTPQNPLL